MSIPSATPIPERLPPFFASHRILNFIWWAGLSLLLCIGLGAGVAVIKFARTSAHKETSCFLGYYTASRLALSGEAKGNMQDFEWFRRQSRLYASRASDIFFGNPPSAALTLLPLAGLPHKQARV